MFASVVQKFWHRRLRRPDGWSDQVWTIASCRRQSTALGTDQSETVGVVGTSCVAAKASKHRLTELRPVMPVPSVLAGTAVLENSPGNLGQAKGIITAPDKRAKPSVRK